MIKHREVKVVLIGVNKINEHRLKIRASMEKASEYF